MRRLAALCLALFLPAALTAQGYPALHDVSGVSENDILYIRDEPSTRGSVIGAFEHDQTGIEVIREEDGWGMVNSEEGVGWASLDFLERVPERADFPAVCFGTEPFWNLSRKQYTGSPERWLVFEPMDGETSNFLAKSNDGELGAPGGMALYGKNASEFLVFLARRESCNDGMSDRQFGISADIVIGNEESLGRVSGCCSLVKAGQE